MTDPSVRVLRLNCYAWLRLVNRDFVVIDYHSGRVKDGLALRCVTWATVIRDHNDGANSVPCFC